MPHKEPKSMSIFAIYGVELGFIGPDHLAVFLLGAAMPLLFLFCVHRWLKNSEKFNSSNSLSEELDGAKPSGTMKADGQK